MTHVRISRLSLTTILAGIVALLFAVPGVQGQAFTLQIDENANGWLNGGYHPGILQLDPGPGGLPGALTYTTPAGPIVGDLLIDEPGGGQSDLVRWNGNATVVFYSDLPEAGETPDLADIGLPAVFYPNLLEVMETGLFGNPYSEAGPNGYVYTPLAGQPGYDPNAPGSQYIIISDIPEPGTVALVWLGMIGLLAVIRSRR